MDQATLDIVDATSFDHFVAECDPDLANVLRAYLSLRSSMGFPPLVVKAEFWRALRREAQAREVTSD